MQLRNYVLVTAGYWTFTVTDGALRMLVLLSFHDLGYSPVSLAFLFLLYEFMGIVTNLIGGWVGARRGLNQTLLAGLSLQIAALVILDALHFVPRTPPRKAEASPPPDGDSAGAAAPESASAPASEPAAESEASA